MTKDNPNQEQPDPLSATGMFLRAFDVEGEKKPSGLTGFRSAKIDADIVARVERQKPAAGQINVQCRGNLRFADSSRRWITGKAHRVADRWNEIAVRSPFEDRSARQTPA